VSCLRESIAWIETGAGGGSERGFGDLERLLMTAQAGNTRGGGRRVWGMA
jgi:hypothetical protein